MCPESWSPSMWRRSLKAPALQTSPANPSLWQSRKVYTVFFSSPSSSDCFVANVACFVALSLGKLAIFRAVLVGRPEPKVTWLRNAGEIDEKFKVLYDKSSGEHQLQVSCRNKLASLSATTTTIIIKIIINQFWLASQNLNLILVIITS